MAAVKLGVSQRAIETEYYLVDLPVILRHKAAETAADRLTALQIATVSQGVDKDVYERFVNGLKADIGSGQEAETDRLDRRGVERLRGRIGR
ncbi:hypothetical protein M6D81_11630 [Paenibacillus sp. J5C_2022]|uniref:hypothetical protein n=1 Tax=Paenibacillus sp. J5C2022 TaxID=2977129 RepID=UPI0021D3654A|nr:hypothetical protein [Paenibacillus sp. J5C2022]MCU6709358.1 hypothetical protein [Paenibacillus sp. J5C2022]